MFNGVYTALITPFKDGKIDYNSLEKIIEQQIAGEVDGIVPLGTTGESPTVSFEEHKEFIKTVVSMVNKRIKVIAGTGANSTDEAVFLSIEAEKAGVDGLLQVNPYYNKPTQSGLIQHFETVAKAVSVPIILYNIPGRSAINFMPESIATLVEKTTNVVAIKEATGDMAQMQRVIELCGDSLTLISGDDNLLLPILAIGGKGVISVLSNLLPKDVKEVITLFNAGKIDKARDAFYKLLPLCRAMFVETNPIPIKAAMHLAGYCENEIRLPMTKIEDDNKQKLIAALKQYGVKL